MTTAVLHVTEVTDIQFLVGYGKKFFNTDGIRYADDWEVVNGAGIKKTGIVLYPWHYSESCSGMLQWR